MALRAATDDLIATAPDLLIATTGIGFRGWVEATENGASPGPDGPARHDTGHLAGPKATGAARRRTA